jgi:hypothetical protein
MIMRFGFVAGMLVVMHPAVGMVMGFSAPGVGVHKPMRVIMQVLMGMGVHGPVMAVGMIMDVQVGMEVLMFMLQFPDGGGGALPKGKREAVEIAQFVVLHEIKGGQISNDPALVHHQGAVGQFFNEKQVMAHQQKRFIKGVQNGHELFFAPWVQSGRGFIQNEQIRVHGKDTAQSQAFALAAGQVQGHPVFKSGQPHPGQGVCGPVPALIS